MSRWRVVLGDRQKTEGQGVPPPSASGPVSSTRDGIDARPRGQSATRRYLRLVSQRIAILVALLILYYATSLHGISARTFILAGVLILFLYWAFKGLL